MNQIEFMNAYAQYQEFQKEKKNGTGIILEQEELAKWELDIKPILDDLRNDLIGYSEDETGSKWVLDGDKTPRMNNKGANFFISEIKHRVHKFTGLTELKDERIIQMCNSVGKTFADLIYDNYERWNIIPEISNMISITDLLVNNLEICLYIAKNAGMRKHRERAKFPFMPQMPESSGGLM